MYNIQKPQDFTQLFHPDTKYCVAQRSVPCLYFHYLKEEDNMDLMNLHRFCQETTQEESVEIEKHHVLTMEIMRRHSQ